MRERSVDGRIHSITYPRLNLNDHTLDCNLPSPGPQLESGQLRLPPRANVGVIDALPLELVQDILSHLDLHTLTGFLRVNRRARDLVDSLPQYEAIKTHALSALRGALSIGTGRWFTCRTLYEKLCTPGCEQCGDFGGYLYLLTCKRVCFLCFTRDRRYLPLSSRQASRKFGLSRENLNDLPHMRAVIGTYSPNVKKVRAASVLIDYESALQAGISFHGSLSAMHKSVTDRTAQELQAYDARVAAAQQSGPTTRRIRQPRTTDPFDGQSGNPFRYVAIVSAPWLDTSLRDVVLGFHCIGCEKSSRPPLHYRRKFTAASFDAHLKQFGDIKDGKHQLV